MPDLASGFFTGFELLGTQTRGLFADKNSHGPSRYQLWLVAAFVSRHPHHIKRLSKAGLFIWPGVGIPESFFVC